MTITAAQVANRVRAQAAQQPQLLPASISIARRNAGRRSQTPRPSWARKPGNNRDSYLADTDLVARIREYTMLGDAAGDAYAALIRTHGFRHTVDMLVQACDHGVDAVTDAPPELVALIREMEQVPGWLDRRLVEEGAAYERNSTANIAPWLVRGAFIATFLNKYSALPMALTGTLGHATAARRVKETATFFATTALPGALERYGPGFKAAAMVRLMHSMVRVNLLSREGLWDAQTYGMPIPQLDQMPAGLIPIYFLSLDVLKDGRTSFNRLERARVELARYRCYLLGLPEDLLADTPEAIVRIWRTRSATLRYEYDDAVCGGLLRATMEAELSTDPSLIGRIKRRLERSVSRVFFVKLFLEGDAERAASVGVPITGADRLIYEAELVDPADDRLRGFGGAHALMIALISERGGFTEAVRACGPSWPLARALRSADGSRRTRRDRPGRTGVFRCLHRFGAPRCHRRRDRTRQPARERDHHAAVRRSTRADRAR